MTKLNTGFSRVRDEDLDNKVQSIVTAITGNANFPAAGAQVTAVQTALSAFQQALGMPPGQARDAAVTAARATLTGAVETLARTLELTAGVTDEMLATTGFDMRQTPSRTGAPVDAPANVRLKATGTSGEAQVLFDPVNRAKAYEVQFTQDPNGQWSDGGTFGSTRNVILKGLTRAKDYWARVRAVGPDGAGGWSDPATILIA